MYMYLAKYLPVEEEIKEGDYRLENGHVYYTPDALTAKNVVNYAKKLKLFLVSRDIQVGDEYINTITNKKHFCTHELSSVQIQEKLSPGTYIKVIGEISPDALGYVKEGQEFDEDEIKIFGSIHNSYNSSRLTEEEIARIAKQFHKTVLKVEYGNPEHDVSGRTVCTTIYWNETNSIKIKGPCGHFH